MGDVPAPNECEQNQAADSPLDASVAVRVFDEPECPICRENFTESSREQHALECGHKFHTLCLLDTMRYTDVHTCPMCRARPENIRKHAWLKRMAERHPKEKITWIRRFKVVEETRDQRQQRLKARAAQRKRRQKAQSVKQELGSMRERWNEHMSAMEEEIQELARTRAATRLWKRIDQIRAMRKRVLWLTSRYHKLRPSRGDRFRYRFFRRWVHLPGKFRFIRDVCRHPHCSWKPLNMGEALFNLHSRPAARQRRLNA